ITANDVLEYLNDFADNFNLRKYIKFRHYVNYVKPIDNNKWKVQVRDLIHQKTVNYIFDGVMICIG
ncbi:flavin-containing monooxygenase FMO GS-OX3-like, partial [Diaphorina citri]